MAIKFNDFKQYARRISFIEPKNLNTNFVLSMFKTEKISLLPILDKNQKVFHGFISRKNLLLALLEQKDQSISSIDITQLVQKDLTILEDDDYISDIMIALNQHPAVLIKEKHSNKIKWIVSPRVAANALEEYSKAYRLIEKIEHLIREVITKFDLDYKSCFENSSFIPKSPKQLSFGNYIEIFKNEWSKLNLTEDKSYVLDLMDQCRIYRNQLVHFKTTLDKDRNKKLDILYKMFLTRFKPEELENEYSLLRL